MALKRGIVKLDEYTNDWEKEYLKEEKLLKRLGFGLPFKRF